MGAEDAYRRIFTRLMVANSRYYSRFPGDKELVQVRAITLPLPHIIGTR
jgi:hypothetical protein